jgi:hypothetical protein
VRGFFLNLWGRLLAIFNALGPVLKPIVLKKLLEYIFKSLSISGGLKLWLVKTVVTKYYDDAARFIFLNTRYGHRMFDGELQVYRIDKVENGESDEDISDIRDDILNRLP